MTETSATFLSKLATSFIDVKIKCQSRKGKFNICTILNTYSHVIFEDNLGTVFIVPFLLAAYCFLWSQCWQAQEGISWKRPPAELSSCLCQCCSALEEGSVKSCRTHTHAHVFFCTNLHRMSPLVCLYREADPARGEEQMYADIKI